MHARMKLKLNFGPNWFKSNWIQISLHSGARGKSLQIGTPPLVQSSVTGDHLRSSVKWLICKLDFDHCPIIAQLIRHDYQLQCIDSWKLWNTNTNTHTDIDTNTDTNTNTSLPNWSDMITDCNATGEAWLQTVSLLTDWYNWWQLEVMKDTNTNTREYKYKHKYCQRTVLLLTNRSDWWQLLELMKNATDCKLANFHFLPYTIAGKIYHMPMDLLVINYKLNLVQ